MPRPAPVVFFALFFTLAFLHSARAADEVLPNGTKIKFDKVYASDPNLSQWIEGEITGYLPKQKYYKIRSTDGINYTIANDPRWIRKIDADKPGEPAKVASDVAPQNKGAQQDKKDAPQGLGGAIGGLSSDNGKGAAASAKDAPADKEKDAKAEGMPPDGVYNVTNLGALHSVGELEIKGNTYRGLEVSGAYKALKGTAKALDFSEGLAGLDRKITGANYMGLNKLGQPVIKIRYVGSTGFNEELEATKEH